MGWKKNNPGDPCCVDCVILEDEFTRADSSSMGSDWSERSGDWSIASNAAVCDSASGLMVTTASHPDASPDCFVEAVINANTADDVAKVILGYVDDNNYFFAQARFTATNSFLRLGKVVAGVQTMLGFSETTNASGETNLDGKLRVCYANGTITAALYATTTATLPVYTSASETVTGTKVGIGTGTRAGTIAFKEFSWQQKLSVAHPDCPTCDKPCVNCDDGTWPYAMQVEFDGVADADCASCNEYFNDTAFILLPNYLSTSNPGVSECIYNLNLSTCAGLTDMSFNHAVFGVFWRLIVIDDATWDAGALSGDPTHDCADPQVPSLTGGLQFYCDWSASTVTYTPLI